MILTSETQYERCELCFGRGYRPEAHKGNRGGFYARNCSRCDGRGEVPVGTRNAVLRTHQNTAE